MLYKSLALTAVAATSVLAQTRPANVSVCDWYTTALLKENTAENQLKVLTLVVNTAVIGNFTPNAMNINVPGILAPGAVNGTAVNLAKYFSGAVASTNTGGDEGTSVNFLDGGGAEPLTKGMAANDTESKQYTLLTHLYEYFGTLLGCSEQGKGDEYAAYEGAPSMYEVHKFMALSNAEVTYFITQVGLAAVSLGVTVADITPVGTALASLFGMRCAPEMTVIPAQGSQLQAICIDETCPQSMNAVCASYESVVEPKNATEASTTASGTASGTASATGPGTATSGGAAGTATGGSATASTSTVPTGAAVVNVVGFGAVVAGAFALLL